MAFDSKAGTRGGNGPLPSGRLGRAILKGMRALHRRQGMKFQGMDVLFLTTVGRRSGQERKIPLAWFADGDDAWLIVASAAGSRDNPAWYYNVAASPDHVSIELPDGRVLPVVAEQLQGTTRQQAWQQVVTAVPRYLDYQEKTDRPIPIVRLSAAD